MKTYVGTYHHTLDAKNRVFIPAKHRELLGDSFYITRKTSDRCLAIYSESEWEKLSEKLSTFPDSVVGKLKRFLFSQTVSASPDAQGRIVLSNELLQYAGIEKNVTIIGAGDHVQIWADNLLMEDNSSLDMDQMRELLPSIGL